jgi:hypothetical protein
VIFFTLSKFVWSQQRFCMGNSKFWRICKKCLRELTQCSTPSQFPQTFHTNPSKLRFYLWKNSYCDHRNFDSVTRLIDTNISAVELIDSPN